MKCKECSLEIDLIFTSKLAVAKPQDSILAQCPLCKMVAVIPAQVWFVEGELPAGVK